MDYWKVGINEEKNYFCAYMYNLLVCVYCSGSGCDDRGVTRHYAMGKVVKVMTKTENCLADTWAFDSVHEAGRYVLFGKKWRSIAKSRSLGKERTGK
mgnify:CR=1 FL=1